MNRIERHMRGLLSPSLLVVSALSAGCGSGRTDDSDPATTPVSLESRSDVLRETGNFVAIGFGTSLSTPPMVQPTPPFEAGLDADSDTDTNVNPPPGPDCDAGGTQTENTGHKSRSFELYVAATEVNFLTFSYQACQDDLGDGYFETRSGVNEIGFSGTSADGVSYGYEAIGDKTTGTALRFEQSGPDRSTVGTTLGVIESRQDSMTSETRIALATSNVGDRYSASTVFGDDTSPYVVSNDRTLAPSAYRFDGPYRYESSVCTGGSLTISTPEAVTYANGYPNGGTVTLSSGSSSVNVTFQPDGTATYEINGGAIGAPALGESTGTLTRDEIREAAENGC